MTPTLTLTQRWNLAMDAVGMSEEIAEQLSFAQSGRPVSERARAHRRADYLRDRVAEIADLLIATGSTP